MGMRLFCNWGKRGKVSFSGEDHIGENYSLFVALISEFGHVGGSSSILIASNLFDGVLLLTYILWFSAMT
ncbi:hypothetical protein L6452_44715 [Arctium lappa]|uniref:Uncharacterized protein n=1 Tax=Arctium lappa TaxID=4217 RepID=A0ACB8XGH0_ARCLA|nr:hypothetical protein L6452_44715 [Arctium lappa]